jgi:predicted nuclease with TOPRIM domain
MNPLFRNVGYAAIVVMVGVYVFLEMSGPRGISELRNKRDRIERLQIENAELERQNKYRDTRIEDLLESREEQELEIRRRFRKQKKGTIDFYLPPGEAATDQSAEESNSEAMP